MPSGRSRRVPRARTAPAAGGVRAGRGAELDWLAGWWERTRAGRAGRVLLSGPAGIGKTSLVDRFCDGIGDGTVVRVDAEAGAPAGSVLGRLVEAVGLAAGDVRRDVVAEVLRALGELQHDGPVLLVLEDLHRVDAGSATVLARVLRRLRDDQVLTVATTRGDGLVPPWTSLFADSADTDARVLGGLDAEAVADVARALRPGPWRAGALAHLAEQTAGHPLHLVTLLRELPDEVLAGRLPFPAPRPLATEVGDVVARLDGPARTVLAALSVLGRPVDRTLVERVAELRRERMDAVLAELRSTGLVDVEGAGPRPALRIHHPLQAGAIRDGLGGAERSALHLAAARALGGQEALDHRTAAADGRPDPSLAADLEAAAAAEPVDHSAAAARLLDAADVAGTGAEAERLRLAAGIRLVEAHDAERLASLAPRVRGAAPCAERAVILGFLAGLDNDPDAAEYLRAALDDVAAPAEVRALAGVRLALENVVRGRGAPAVEAASAASALTSRPMRREQATMHRVLGIALQDGPAAGLQVLGASVDTALGPDLPITAGTLHLAAGDVAPARARLQEGLDRARHGGSSVSMHRGHLHLAEALFRCGRWDLAEAQAEIALAWFADGDRSWAEAAAHAVAALVPAARGHREAAEQHLSVARASQVRTASPQGRRALAMTETILARSVAPDRMLAAVAGLAEGASRRGFLAGTWAPWRPLYAEALLEAGRVDDAGRVMDAWPSDGEPSWFALARHRLRGRVAAAQGDPDAAASWFRSGLAVDADAEDCRVEIAELRLALGTVQAERGEAGAGPLLDAARETFAALGATAWVRRVDAVHATGNVPHGTALTPRERQVTSCILAGMTRREAAEALWVTPKAVDYHLRNAYAKLGISSRRELRGLSVSGTVVGGAG